MIQIQGKVIKGQQYGRTLGFPTVNLDRRSYSRRKQKIRLGVWAGRAELGESKLYRAAIVIGPIDNRRLPKLEAHLIGFKGNLYGKNIIITLEKYLRPFKKFESEAKLRQQIALDVKNIKSIK